MGPQRGRGLDPQAPPAPNAGASPTPVPAGSASAAKKLSLYQVLAPSAFSPVAGFVPVLQKTVSSTVHEVARPRSPPPVAGRLVVAAPFSLTLGE